MNEEQKPEDIQSAKENKKNQRNLTGAIVLLVIGVFFLVENFMPSFDIGKFWPVILIVIGLVMIFRRK
jgi:membrane-bound ClpP family serine protease